MAKTEYNLPLLYTLAFGHRAVPYDKLSTRIETHQAEQKDKIKAIEFQSDDNSLMGTPIFMPCTLTFTNGNRAFKVKLPNEPIIEISGSKTIIRTAIDSQEGTFKELYSVNDYVISIKGLIVQEDGTDNYPEKETRQLRSLCESVNSIEVTDNKLLSIFGINKLVMENYSFPALEGFQGVQPYQFSLWSDRTFEIEKKIT